MGSHRASECLIFKPSYCSAEFAPACTAISRRISASGCRGGSQARSSSCRSWLIRWISCCGHVTSRCREILKMLINQWRYCDMPQHENGPYPGPLSQKPFVFQVVIVGWGTWIRTKTNRVRVCCATVTPFPNGIAGRIQWLIELLGRGRRRYWRSSRLRRAGFLLGRPQACKRCCGRGRDLAGPPEERNRRWPGGAGATAVLAAVCLICISTRRGRDVIS